MGRKKRSYPAKLKFQVVLELLKGEKEIGQIARAYNIHPASITRWKKKFLEDGAEVFSQDSSIKQYEKRLGELERIIGKKEIEIALYKNFLGNSA